MSRRENGAIDVVSSEAILSGFSQLSACSSSIGSKGGLRLITWTEKRCWMSKMGFCGQCFSIHLSWYSSASSVNCDLGQNTLRANLIQLDLYFLPRSQFLLACHVLAEFSGYNSLPKLRLSDGIILWNTEFIESVCLHAVLVYCKQYINKLGPRV